MTLFRNTIISLLVALTAIVLFQHRIQDTATVAFEFIKTLAPAAFLISNKTNTNTDHHLYATEMSVTRAIRKVFLAIEQSEGAGARVRRSIGTPQLRNFSPFLMLDHFSIKPGAGFPDQYVFLHYPPLPVSSLTPPKSPPRPGDHHLSPRGRR